MRTKICRLCHQHVSSEVSPGIRRVKCPHCQGLLLAPKSKRATRKRVAKLLDQLPPAELSPEPISPDNLPIQLADLQVGTPLVRTHLPEQVYYVIEVEPRKGVELVTVAKAGSHTGRQVSLLELNRTYRLH